MTEIGIRLKEARESKGLTLRELYEITKIQPKYLSALEQEKFEIFPGDVYIKGALRNYAVVLDLNPAEIMKLYSEAYAQNAVADKENITTISTGNKKEIFSPSDGLNKRKVALLLLLTAFIVWLIYYTASRVDLNFLNDNDVEQIQPDNNGMDADIPPDIPPDIEDPPPEEEDLESVEEPVEVVLVHEDVGSQVFAVKNAEIIFLEMKFSANCWIFVKKEGISVRETIFREGETYLLESDKELIIRIGYPAGVSAIVVNGISLPLRGGGDPFNLTLQLE